MNKKEEAVFAAKYDKMLEDLHSSWTPHEGQKKIGYTLFQRDIREIFLQCGRKFGKTDIVIYIARRWAYMNPGAGVYYIAPFAKQAREIVWASKRIQNFGNWDNVLAVNNTEMRVTYKNGSFIKCDGSDNFEAYRGINPHLIIYDEFKDFRPEFHVAMEPNLATYNAPLIIIGTPPDKEGQYTELAKEFREDPNKAWFRMPSYMNPHISKDWLDKKKATLINRGEIDVWEREYEAKFVKGGKSSIFPMLHESMVLPHSVITASIKRDRRKLHWYCVADPGSTTCFAVLFAAINPYTKEIFLMDEIYETDQKKTTVRQIGSQIIEKQHELNPKGEWQNYRDLAATWFESEMYDMWGDDYFFMGVAKEANKKEHHLSLIKDALLSRRIKFSSRCVKMFWEMGNYVKDKNGKIPKEDDHLIDCLRYLIEADRYELRGSPEPIPEHLQEDFRGRTIEQDIAEGMYDDDSLGIKLPVNLEGL